MLIDFQVSGVCEKGAHALVTMRRDGSPIASNRVTIEALKDDAADVDAVKALWDLGLEMIRRENPPTRAALKTFINGMSITMGP